MLNGILEDIGAEMGFTATSVLAAWFGGQWLYVPQKADPNHPVAKLVGISAYKKLVENWGGTSIKIPTGSGEEIARRDRTIAEMLHNGMGSKAIAEQTGLTERRVQQIRLQLESSGLIPLILK